MVISQGLGAEHDQEECKTLANEYSARVTRVREITSVKQKSNLKTCRWKKDSVRATVRFSIRCSIEKLAKRVDGRSEKSERKTISSRAMKQNSCPLNGFLCWNVYLRSLSEKCSEYIFFLTLCCTEKCKEMQKCLIWWNRFNCRTIYCKDAMIGRMMCQGNVF